MNYQVCYRYICDTDNIWYARFFETRKEALKYYHDKKDDKLFKRDVKILTIGGKVCPAQEQAA